MDVTGSESQKRNHAFLLTTLILPQIALIYSSCYPGPYCCYFRSRYKPLETVIQFTVAFGTESFANLC